MQFSQRNYLFFFFFPLVLAFAFFTGFFLAFLTFFFGRALAFFRLFGRSAFAGSGGRGQFAFLFFSRFFLDHYFFGFFNEIQRLLQAFFFVRVQAWQLVFIIVVRFGVKHSFLREVRGLMNRFVPWRL